METFLEELAQMSVKEVVAQITIIIGIISVIIEKSKKLPFNPWSKLFKWVGEKMTSSISNQINVFKEEQKNHIAELDKRQTARMEALEKSNLETQESIEHMHKEYKESIKTIREEYNARIDKLEYSADEKEVKRLRSNIICFADSCRNGDVKHTKQHFENIFRDYDDYLSYCKARNFQNHFIDGEMEYIKAVYTEASKGNKFI